MKVARILVLAASLPAMAALLAQPAQAQRNEVLMPGGVVPAGTLAPPTPEEVLATNLRVLAANPRDVAALTRAGQSALAVGDPNAALGFFARAEQLAPADGRVKAGLGSAMVMMERPSDAMPLFQQAAALGAPERDYVRERGLAHDLLGNNRAAQRDYVAALRYGPDAETTRRHALSLGISGDRDQALRLLEPLLRQQDQGAWRARAFVLALNGDQRGAERIVQQVMPGGMGTQMLAFLRKLPALNPSQRAAAVNFGTIPGTGPSYAPTYASAELSEPVRAIPGSMTDTLTREEVIKPSFVADAAPSRRKNERAKRRRPGRDSDERPVQVAVAVPPVAVPAPATRQPIAGPGFTVLPTAELPPPYQKAPVPARPAGAAPAIVQIATAPTPASRVEPRTPADPPEPSAVFEISAAPQPPAARPASLPAPAARPTAMANATPAPAPAPAAVSPTSVAIPPRPAVAAVSPAPIAAPSPPVAAPARVAVSLPPVVSTAPLLPAQAIAAPAVSAPPPPAAQPTTPPTPALSAPPPLSKPVSEVATAAVSPAPAPTNSARTEPLRADAIASAQASPPEQSATVAAVPAGPPSPLVVTQRPAAQALIGPPAPEPVASALAAPSPSAPTALPPESATISAPAAAAVSEPIQMASAAETSTPLEDPQADAGLSALLDDLQPEESAETGLPAGDEAFRRARLAAKRKAEADIKAKELAETKAKADAEAKALKAEEDAKRAEARKHPPRVWVQVATGSAKSGIGITVKRVREQAGDTLKGAGAASVPFKATNRILMGPYRSEAEARQVVNGLAKKGLQANIFTSDAGQQVSTLSGR